MSQKRPRGPYKKYLVDAEEPVPKRSLTFYCPKFTREDVSASSSAVDPSQAEQANDQPICVEDNENASGDDGSESHVRALTADDQHQETASCENFDNTSQGHLEPDSEQGLIGDQSSSSSSQHRVIPPVRLNVNDPTWCNKANSTPSHSNDGSDTEDEKNTIDPETEVDIQDEQLVSVDYYVDDENESEYFAGGEEDQEGEEEQEGVGGDHEEESIEAEEEQDSLHGEEEERFDETEEEQGNGDNNEQPNENLEVLPGHQKLWKAIKNNPTFTSPITTEVNSSPAEMLLKLLGLREQNNLSFKAFVDTARLVNSIFVSPVVQGTQYLLDELLLSSTGVSRYFYCKKCSYSFGKVDHKATPELQCPKCETNNPLKDLTKATYFVLFPIDSQIELLLMDKEVRESLLDPEDAIKQNTEKNILKDVYDGICYREFVASLPENLVERVISCVFCTDGSPLFKSSSYSIWPFFLCINELPPLIRMRNLLLGGLWFGNKHPPMDLFLKPVVDHLSLLSHPGFKVKVDGEVWKMRLYTIACCVDSGARGAVQGINSHSGYYSCNWCLIPGMWLDKLVFPFEEVASAPRSHNGLIENGRECLSDDKLVYVYGVQYVSPIVKLPKFDIVRGMVQDFPHNIPFGIARTFLDEWLNNSKRSFYIGSPDERSILNRRMDCLKPCVEVRRGIRPLKDMAYWKAREFENWILFYSLVVLLNVLPPAFWTHWSYLVQAVYLLSRECVSAEHVNTAHKLLQYWVADVQRLYGEKYMSFNVHICGHLAENASRWGPCWAVCTYCFESAIGELKNILHAHRGVPHQVERELSYCQAKRILLNTCQTLRAEMFLDDIKSKPNKGTTYLSLEECVVIGKGEDFLPNQEQRFLMSQFTHDIDDENCVVYSKIIASRCVYTTDAVCVGKKYNNSVALTTSGSIVILKKFIRDKATEKVYFFCVEADYRVFLKFSLGVRILPQDHCVKVINSIGRRLKLLSVKDLKIVCVQTEMEGKIYVTPFHNLFNVC